MRHTFGWQYLFGVALITSVALVWSTNVFAAIVSITVNDTGSLGTFEGRRYIWVQAKMEGSVDRADGTTSHYRVPISLHYPATGSNSIGLMDIVNVADFLFWTGETAPLQRPRVYYSGDLIFSDYLRREGYTYLSVQWSRVVTEALGPGYGVIENGSDGYQILADAATLLRTLPDAIALPVEPAAVGQVIAHGASLSAGLLWDMARSEDPMHGAFPFDGLLLTGLGSGYCNRLTDDATPQEGPGVAHVALFFEFVDCAAVPRDVKMLSIRTQTEAEVPVEYYRYKIPTLRVYDVAGVSHMPQALFDLRDAGASRQNPVDWRPVAKAALRSLTAWVTSGTEPPPSVFFTGEIAADGSLVLARDDDGNGLGGLRLPHLRSVTPNGEPMGAPLGIYGGLDPILVSTEGAGYAKLGGTFEPFDRTELTRRYPSYDHYVSLVTKAARELVENGYILPEDFSAYVRAAERQRW